MSADAFMVERVARAICEQALCDRRGYALNEEVEREWHRYAALALAAIEVLTGDGDAVAFRTAVHAAWKDVFLAF